MEIEKLRTKIEQSDDLEPSYRDDKLAHLGELAESARKLERALDEFESRIAESERRKLVSRRALADARKQAVEDISKKISDHGILHLPPPRKDD